MGTTAIRMYQYGLLRSRMTGSEIVRAQMRLAHNYRNELTAIERGRRAALRALEAEMGLAELEAAVAAAQAECEAATNALSAERAETRRRSASPEARARLDAARAVRSEAKRRFGEARQAATGEARLASVATNDDDPIVARYLAARAAYDGCKNGPNSAERATLRDALGEVVCAIHDAGMNERPVHFAARRAAIEYRASGLIRAARAASGVPQGTYSAVEDAMDAARKAPLYDGIEPTDPKFIRWGTRGGIVGVQIHGGIDPEEVAGGEGAWLRIVPRAETKTGRRSGQRMTLWMRVGSDDRRRPIWATWPMIMHRPLPKGSQIRRAVVMMQPRGTVGDFAEEWRVLLTVALPDDAVPRARGTGAVALDVGWRILGDEVRIASWVGEDGATGELRLSADDLRGLALGSELRSIRDDAFNAARLRLQAWLDAHADAPVWLREATKTLSQWRSVDRLARVARRWTAEQPEAARGALRPRLRAAKGETIETADGWEALEAWRYHDDHLRTWQVGQRESALRSRREIYRLFAVGLARRYGTLVLEDFDLRPMARRPKRTDAPRENETARSNRHRVAVSKLRDALTQAFGGAVEIDPAGTTHLCHRCGTHNDFDAAEHLIHRCVNCETTWDQDENAARNLLARYLRERSGDAQTPGGARKDGKPSDSKPVHRSKHARKAAAKAARIEALKAAREGVDNAAE